MWWCCRNDISMKRKSWRSKKAEQILTFSPVQQTLFIKENTLMAHFSLKSLFFFFYFPILSLLLSALLTGCVCVVFVFVFVFILVYLDERENIMVYDNVLLILGSSQVTMSRWVTILMMQTRYHRIFHSLTKSQKRKRYFVLVLFIQPFTFRI